MTFLPVDTLGLYWFRGTANELLRFDK